MISQRAPLWFAATGLALLAGSMSVTTAGSVGAGPAPAPVVVEGDVIDTYTADPGGVAVDSWIVWICAIDAGGPVPPVAITATQAAGVLNTDVAPYFEWLSEGAYRATFTAGGTLPAGTNDAELANCSDAAMTAPASAGFAGAVVIVDAVTQNAFAQSGHQSCTTPPCTGSTTLPTNRRYAELAAQNILTTIAGGADLATTSHELGHALDWGHAGAPQPYRSDQPGQTGSTGIVDPQAPWIDDLFPGFVTWFDAAITSFIPPLPTLGSARAAVGAGPVDCSTALPPTPGFTICALYGSLEYGDVTDIMGTTPTPLSTDRGAIPQTQVFNRYAAGWVAPDDVETSDGTFAEYDVAPLGVDGTQMVVIRTDDSRRYFTIEARADSPFLGAARLRPGAENAGVFLHLVDQRPDACGRPLCWGDVGWKTMMAEGTPWTFDHVLSVGERTTVDGIPVEVVAHNGDGTYTLRIGEPPNVDPSGPSDPLDVDSAPSPRATATPVPVRPAFTG